LLIQVPPTVGENAVVDPTQSCASPVSVVTGRPAIVIGAVGSDVHIVEKSIKLKVTIPADKAVT
jgi:ribosomal protein S3